LDVRRPTPAPLLAIVLAGILMMLGAYMGAYYAMLEERAFIGPPAQMRPEYRWQGRSVARFFWPANQLDRIVRPHAWKVLFGG
jgi:hypothetical protein